MLAFSPFKQIFPLFSPMPIGHPPTLILLFLLLPLCLVYCPRESNLELVWAAAAHTHPATHPATRAHSATHTHSHTRTFNHTHTQTHTQSQTHRQLTETNH